MNLDKNSFNLFTNGELDDVYNFANEYYRSAALDRRLSNSQQVSRAYVEAVLSVAVTQGYVSLQKKGQENATDTSSINDDN